MSRRALCLVCLILALLLQACQGALAAYSVDIPTVSTLPPVILLPTSTPPPPPPTPSPYPTIIPTSSPDLPTEVPTATLIAEPALVITASVPSTLTLALTPTASAAAPVTKAASKTQMQVFEELSRIIRNDYLYRDFNGRPWDIVYQVYKHRIEAGMNNETFYTTMHELVSLLGDDHSNYFSPTENSAEKSQYAGKDDFVGIGVILAYVPQRKRVTILIVFPKSPAEEAGLKSHDSILEIDGKPVYDENEKYQDLLHGPEGSQAILKVQTPGEDPRLVLVTRRRVTGSTPVPYQVLTTSLGKRIGYILLTSLAEVTVPGAIGKAIKTMSTEGQLDGLILDDRLNPGGSSDVLSQTLAYFTQGTVGYFVIHQERYEVVIDPKNLRASQTIPLVVLIGPNTASFGETFAGILKDQDRAYLIGQNTMGNVELLNVYDFSDGSEAWIAFGTFQLANHPETKWEGVGVAPDFPVTTIWDAITPEMDPAIRAGLAYYDTLK